MKRTTMHKALTSLAAAAGCLLVTSAVASAQEHANVANVPFSFVANGVAIKPGKILIEREGGKASLVSNHGGSMMYLVGGNRTSGEGHLTFLKNGDRYILTEVAEDGGTVSKVPISPRDRESLETAQVPERVHVTLVASR